MVNSTRRRSGRSSAATDMACLGWDLQRTLSTGVVLVGAADRLRTAGVIIRDDGPDSFDNSMLRGRYLAVADKWRTSSILYREATEAGAEMARPASTARRHPRSAGLLIVHLCFL